LVFVALGPTADAQVRSPGQRAYHTALRFARNRNLPHFSQPTRAGLRLVVNVTNEHAAAWAETFAPAAEADGGYVEPFFTASPTSAPGWSRLRIGGRAFMKYGDGAAEDFDPQTGGSRFNFPVWLSAAEHAEFVGHILHTPNLPFNYNGGIESGTGQNCTDWLTSKIGQYTGVRTSSVKHHLQRMVEGPFSERMTVLAISSPDPIESFGPESIRLHWEH
jgi:hypothetical protein